MRVDYDDLVSELDAKQAKHRTGPDIELVRACAHSRDAYEAARPFVKDYVTTPEIVQVISDIGSWYAAHPDTASVGWSEFLAWGRISLHPTWLRERWDAYSGLVGTVAESATVNAGIIERFREMHYAARIREAAEKVLAYGGTEGIAAVAEIASAYGQSGAQVAVEEEPELEAMLESLVRGGGLDWRLEDLNVSIGPLHRGDLVLVGARPEAGKTTFLCAEFTHMVTQLPEGTHAVIFNNEEIATKIRVRLIQSMLGASLTELLGDPKGSQAEYRKRLAGRRIDVVHDTALSVTDVEKRLKGSAYGLIGFNILDKVQGFAGREAGETRDVERLRSLGIWARGLADRFGVVFALAQADASAEGQRELTQAQLYGTKTGLVAESDAMLMLGKDNSPGLSNRRWVNVVRNKLPGGPRTVPGNRHGVFEVEFDGERARYNTLVKEWKQ